jgi:uncharacterized protein
MTALRVAFQLALAGALGATVMAQSTTPRKRLLVIGEEKGYRHEAVTHAMATIERLGRDTGLWETVIRTDTEALTKTKLEYNAGTLNDFDAVLFYTGGTWGRQTSAAMLPAAFSSASTSGSRSQG